MRTHLPLAALALAACWNTGASTRSESPQGVTLAPGERLYVAGAATPSAALRESAADGKVGIDVELKAKNAGSTPVTVWLWQVASKPTGPDLPSDAARVGKADVPAGAESFLAELHVEVPIAETVPFSYVLEAEGGTVTGDLSVEARVQTGSRVEGGQALDLKLEPIEPIK